MAENNLYVTYKWLVTTIIASTASILLLIGAVANATFYPKVAGAAIEERLNATDVRFNEMSDTLKEVRQDVKLILAKQGR